MSMKNHLVYVSSKNSVCPVQGFLVAGHDVVSGKDAKSHAGKFTKEEAEKEVRRLEDGGFYACAKALDSQ
jgi:hypothetical protein